MGQMSNAELARRIDEGKKSTDKLERRIYSLTTQVAALNQSSKDHLQAHKSDRAAASGIAAFVASVIAVVVGIFTKG